jgi:hypothetical protein
MINIFFDHVNEISVSFLLIISVFHIIRSFLKDETMTLDKLLTPAMAAATIPTGIALIICAFSPSNVSKLESINVHLAIAGIALIFLAIHTIKQGIK